MKIRTFFIICFGKPLRILADATGKILDIYGGGWVIFPMKLQKSYGSFVNSTGGPKLHFRKNVYKFFIDLFFSVS